MQTDFQPIENTKFLINIPEADNINYVVTFLTGSVPLPIGMAGAVYWSWPDPLSPSKWQLLGYISNNKPSAIFRIQHIKKLHELEAQETIMNFGEAAISHSAQIGISIEPEINLSQQAAMITNNEAVSHFEFGKKMLENFFNFASSFSITQAQMVPNPSETYVPLSTLSTWYQNFQRRLEQNPNFWK